MKKNEVEVGKRYVMKVAGKLTVVKLTSESVYGGWNGTNEKTGRQVRVKTAAKLRCEASHPSAGVSALRAARGIGSES